MTKKSLSILSRIWTVAVLLLPFIALTEYLLACFGPDRELVSVSGNADPAEAVFYSLVNIWNLYRDDFIRLFIYMLLIFCIIYEGVSLLLLYVCCAYQKKRRRISPERNVLFALWNQLILIVTFLLSANIKPPEGSGRTFAERFQTHPVGMIISVAAVVFLIVFHIVWIWFTFRRQPQRFAAPGRGTDKKE